MPLVVSAAAAVSALSNAVNIFKSLQGIPESEMKGKILDLQGAMMEVQLRQMELIQENQQLAEENRELKDQSVLRSTLAFHYDAYWQQIENETLDGPFARLPWDVDRKLVRMQWWGRETHGGVDQIQFFDTSNQVSAYVPTSFIMEHDVRHVLAQLQPKKP